MIKYKINFVCKEYGIDAYNNDKLIKSIKKITCSSQDIKSLIMMCNELKIEPCHLEDIVEDYLTDFTVF